MLRDRIAILMVSLIAALVAISPASAGRSWCRSDPDVLLERTHVQVVVAVPDEYVSLVNGPTWMRFNIPSDVDRQLVATDAGFNNLGYTVTYSTSFQPNKFDPKFAVNLTVKVPISGNVKAPILVVVTLPDGTQFTRTGNDAETGTSVNFSMSGTP